MACPDYIVAMLEGPVNRALGQVRAIKRVTDNFNARVQELTGELVDAIVADLDVLVQAIPTPIPLGLGDILDLITCPLLPLALGLDPSLLAQLDPQSLIDKIKAQLREYINKITNDYENGLRALADWPNIQAPKLFLEDLKRAELDTLVFAEAVIISVYVAAVTPDIYAGSVFEAFVDETTDFSITGILPSGINVDVQSLMSKLQVAETKIQGWRILAVV